MNAKQKVLVVGSGGREHALCWKLAQSPLVQDIYCAPGNGGTARSEKTKNIPIPVMDFGALIRFAQQNEIDFTVIGPDNPLAEGIVDAFQAAGLAVFGPTQAAARLESSKAFAKRFMAQAGLPTARFDVFDNAHDALAFCRENTWARVIKVDGLALGKGVFVCDTLADCDAALQDIFGNRRFGESGAKVVIEERLSGPELSLFVLYDGETLLPFSSSQDYKRRFEGDTGPNTGGMGAFSPVPQYSQWEAVIEQTVLQPLADALGKADFTYRGLLFIGLLMQDNQPYVLEFNARFGDPETQCLLPRLENDLFVLLKACSEGRLAGHAMKWSDKASVGVVLAAETYPEKSSSGEPVVLDALPDGVACFHAGTSLDDANILVTSGGRILNLVALGDTLEEARERVYSALSAVSFQGMGYRRDIAREVALCR